MSECEPEGLAGVSGDVADNVAVAFDVTDIDDVGIAGDPVPVSGQPALLDVPAFVQHVEVGMPMRVVRGQF